MAPKKDPGKFTIRFYLTDPTQRKVSDLLDTMKRSKAQFICNAVMHYIHCPQTPDIPQPAPADEALIEAVVRRILSEQNGLSKGGQTKAVQSAYKNIQKSEEILFDEAVELLDEDSLEAISNTLAAIRKK